MSPSREYKIEYEKSRPEYVNLIRRKSYAVKQIAIFESKLLTEDETLRKKNLAKLQNYKNNLEVIEEELISIREKYGMRTIARK